MGAIVQGRTLSRPFDAGLADERRRQCRAAVHVATFVQLLQHLPQSPVPRLLCTHVRISVQYSINCWMWGREQPMLPYHRREPTRENPPERTPTGENPHRREPPPERTHRREPTGENPLERTPTGENPPERNHRREPERKWLCWLCGECVLGLYVCDNRDGWLVAWGLCGCMLGRFSTMWLLPFTLL